MSIENIKDFRDKNVTIFEKTFDNKNSIRIEKGVFNFAISEAKKKNIVRNWDNKYFMKLYMDRLRSIYINLKNINVINKIKNKEITMKELFRIGQIVPSSNITMETEIPAMLRARESIFPERFTFHSSRMRMKSVTESELKKMDSAGI